MKIEPEWKSGQQKVEDAVVDLVAAWKAYAAANESNTSDTHKRFAQVAVMNHVAALAKLVSP